MTRNCIRESRFNSQSHFKKLREKKEEEEEDDMMMTTTAGRGDEDENPFQRLVLARETHLVAS